MRVCLSGRLEEDLYTLCTDWSTAHAWWVCDWGCDLWEDMYTLCTDWCVAHVRDWGCDLWGSVHALYRLVCGTCTVSVWLRVRLVWICTCSVQTNGYGWLRPASVWHRGTHRPWCCCSTLLVCQVPCWCSGGLRLRPGALGSLNIITMVMYRQFRTHIKVIDIGVWSICGEDLLYIYMYIYAIYK